MKKILLFDFDGVVVDSEKHYTIFWNRIGEERLGIKDFGAKIKGTTLTSILNTYFENKDWGTIIKDLDEFESKMPFDYIKGIVDFLNEAKTLDMKTAIVTSSNLKKMDYAYRQHPEISELFDKVFTSEDFSASKPSPDCYLKAMAYFEVKANQAVVFEDSINGLISGKSSRAYLVGLSTTNPADTVAEYADLVIPDFTFLTPDAL